MTAQGPIILALDAMGGDYAPAIVVEGASRFVRTHHDVTFLLYGDTALLTPLLQSHPQLKALARVIHTEGIIASDEKPSTALRKSKGTSMRAAIEAVHEGAAHAMVSAGNTGALMAIAKLMLRTIEGINRPAIVTMLPSLAGPVVMLDLGANVDCTSEHLMEFAIMGNAFCKVTLGTPSPTIGLLNIGSEEMKGNDTLRQAYSALKETHLLNFKGFVEGDDIAHGTTNVIVTDGFSGNIALKTAEGVAHLIRSVMKKSLRRTPLSMLGGLLAYRSMKAGFKQVDPSNYNGAMLVGLNGIVVKSHGSATHHAFRNAIDVAYTLAKNSINDEIIAEIHQFNDERSHAISE